MIGITGFGGYVPRLRLSRQAIQDANAWFAPNLKARARGHRSMASWDEDTITMSVAAARDCLGPDADTDSVGTLYLASTTAPFADRLNAGIATMALNLRETTEAVDLGGTRRSGLTALSQALTRSAATGRSSLVAASDLRRTRVGGAAEMDYGDAAAALLVGGGDVLAEPLASASITVDFVDRFRSADAEFDYQWEERWIRDEGVMKIVPKVVAAVLAQAGLAADAISHFILPTAFAKLDQQVAKRCGIGSGRVVASLNDRIGECGTPQALLMLAGLLERARPGETILVTDFGNGAEAMLFRVTDAIDGFRPARGVSGWLARGVEETSYTKLLVFRGAVDFERGMRGEQDRKTALSTLYRHRSAILGMVAGKCRETGSVHFPPSRLSYDRQGPLLDTQEPYRLSDRKAHVLSWSAERLSFYLAPPHQYGQVDFEGGGRLLMEFTDVAPGDIATGTEVEMVFRVKDFDRVRDFTRYFWKAVPVAYARPG